MLPWSSFGVTFTVKFSFGYVTAVANLVETALCLGGSIRPQAHGLVELSGHSILPQDPERDLPEALRAGKRERLREQQAAMSVSQAPWINVDGGDLRRALRTGISRRGNMAKSDDVLPFAGNVDWGSLVGA